MYFLFKLLVVHSRQCSSRTTFSCFKNKKMKLLCLKQLCVNTLILWMEFSFWTNNCYCVVKQANISSILAQFCLRLIRRFKQSNPIDMKCIKLLFGKHIWINVYFLWLYLLFDFFWIYFKEASSCHVTYYYQSIWKRIFVPCA